MDFKELEDFIAIAKNAGASELKYQKLIIIITVIKINNA